MLQTDENALSRIVVAWIAFWEGLTCRITEVVIETWHCLTTTINECTEFKSQQSSNYDLSTHSNTEKTHTHTHIEKALAGVYPSGIWLILRAIYSGSIFDGNISEKSDFVSWVAEKNEILSDKLLLLLSLYL